MPQAVKNNADAESVKQADGRFDEGDVAEKTFEQRMFQVFPIEAAVEGGKRIKRGKRKQNAEKIEKCGNEQRQAYGFVKSPERLHQRRMAEKDRKGSAERHPKIKQNADGQLEQNLHPDRPFARQIEHGHEIEQNKENGEDEFQRTAEDERGRVGLGGNADEGFQCRQPQKDMDGFKKAQSACAAEAD